MISRPETSPMPENVAAEDTQERQRKRIEAIYQDMNDLDVVPTRLIQGGTIIDLIIEENTGAAHDRPFMVFEVAHPDTNVQSLIYKVCIENNINPLSRNETIFLEKIAPILTQMMSGDQNLEQITFPTVVNSRTEGENLFCMQTEIEGKIAGGIHNADSIVINDQDTETITRFIRFLHDQITIERIEEIASDIALRVDTTLAKYTDSLTRREHLITAALGKEQFQRMQDLLAQSANFLNEQKPLFVAGDINPSNIIKTHDNKLGMIDWEKIHIINSPAFDYDFMFADLWTNPALQEKFFQEALSLNQDIDQFKELLRLDFIMYRGSGELTHWWQILNNSEDKEEKKIAASAVARYTELLSTALDHTGIWQSENEA